MKLKNKDEKRRSRQRTKERKSNERAEFREKHKTWNQQEKGLTDYNCRLQSGIEKAKILSLITLLCTIGMSAFCCISVALLNGSIFFNSIVLILYIISVFITHMSYTNYMNRCQFYISLAEQPSLPTGVCVPKYMADRSNQFSMKNTFENMNKDEIFTYCSAKRIVITNDSGSMKWSISFIIFLILFYIYISLGDISNIRTPESFTILILCLTFLILTGFLYTYCKKDVFIIDREEKTITIPPLSRFGKNKVLPYQQVVVAFCSGLTPISSRYQTATCDYISLTAKEDLPFGPKVGFRCDSYTQYRFALLICEYMNVSYLDDMPDIKGFENIIDRIRTKE